MPSTQGAGTSNQQLYSLFPKKKKPPRKTGEPEYEVSLNSVSFLKRAFSRRKGPLDKGKMKLGLLTRFQTGEQDQGLSLAEGLHHNQERKTREAQVVSMSHLGLQREDPGAQVM